jgi:plasmid stability protein
MISKLRGFDVFSWAAAMVHRNCVLFGFHEPWTHLNIPSHTVQPGNPALVPPCTHLQKLSRWRDTWGTTLTVRNVDAAVKAQLCLRAARHGRSMEAELRSNLTDALASECDHEPDLAEAIWRRFAALGDVELEAQPPVAIGPPPIFDP